jgi:NAD+ diphosphatase
MAEDATEFRLPFSLWSLDRFGEQRRDGEFMTEMSGHEQARLLLVIEGSKVPVGDDGSLSWIPLASARAGEPLVFLGRDDEDRPIFARAALDIEIEQKEAGGQYAQLREIGTQLADCDAAAAVQAVALAAWHARTANCVRCGGATAVEDAGHLRRCLECGESHFPRTDPAVIMLVTDGERCVLGRRTGAPEGRWSTLAGYVEAGESLESAVVREVREEVGLRVTGLSYRGSQPWPFPASLMVAFEATADYAPLTLNDEHQEVQWFTRDEVVAGLASGEMTVPGPISAGRFLIESWLAKASATD